MANTKSYRIQINGITESVDAIKALQDQLKQLDRRIRELSGATVNVKTTTTSTQSQKSNTAQENNLLKEQEKIHQKIASAQTEEYINTQRLNNELKNTQTIAKSIADQKALSGDMIFGENTLAGLKERLRQIKSAMQGLDVGSDEFKKLTEQAGILNERLKEIEKSYGVFGRDVGHYENATKSMSAFSISIGGVEKNFNNLMQAMRYVRNELGTLEVQGQSNTKRYQELTQTLDQLTKAQQRLNSTMNDAKQSSKAMDNILDAFQSLTALQSMSTGLAGFFNIDDSKLQRSIQKMFALQNVLRGLETIKKQLNTGEFLGGAFKNVNSVVDSFVAKMTGAKVAVDGLTASSKAGTVAVRMLATTLKAAGIGLAITAITYGITKLLDLFENFRNASSAFDTSITSIEKIGKVYDDLQSKLKGDLYEGTITQNEYLEKSNENLVNTLEQLKEKYDDLAPSIEKVKKEHEKMINSINTQGKVRWEYMPEGNYLINQFQKVVDGVEEANREGKNLQETFKELWEEFANNEKAQAGLKNLEKAIPDEKMREKFKAIYDEYEKMADAIIIKTDELNKQLRDLSTETMSDGYQKTIREIQNEWDDAIAAAQNNEKLIAAINAKYRKKMQDAAKDEAREARNSLMEVYRLRIENMEDGLKKTIAQLNQSRKEDIEGAVESQRNVEEKIKLINEKYDKDILKAKKEWVEDIQEQYKKLNMAIGEDIVETTLRNISTAIEAADERLKSEMYNLAQTLNLSTYININKGNYPKDIIEKLGLTEIENEVARALDKLNKYMSADIGQVFYPTTVFQMNIKEVQRYQSEYIAAYEEYIKQYEALQRQYIQNNVENEQKMEEQILNERLKELNDLQKLEIESLQVQYNYDEQSLEQNKEYLAALENLNTVYELQRYVAVESFNERLKSIEEQAETELTRIINQKVEERQKVYEEYYNSSINEAQRFRTRLSELLQDAVITDNAGFNIINVKKTRENLKEVENGLIELSNTLNEVQKKAQEDFKEGLISPEAFRNTMDEIEAMRSSITKEMKNIKDDVKDIFGQLIGQINYYVQQIASSVTSLLSTVYSFQDSIYQRQIEQLDEWISEYEKKLDEQETITRKHNDNINSIEEALKTARGDRRQALIDNLNAQKQAQRQSLKEEQRIEKERQKLEQQKEKEELAQKKREHKREITSAMISAALATVNALATKPFIPVGIAMGALAASMGAAQVALISRQKYAKGGLLEGPSHSRGGIPVGRTGIEVEGNEYVINKRTTLNNLDLLNYINSSKKRLNINDFIQFYSDGKVRKNISNTTNRSRFASGGQLPLMRNDIQITTQLMKMLETYNERPIYVSVKEITDTQTNMRNVKTLAGLPD